MSVLSPDIEQFISRYIRSIGHLEAILFLYQRRGMEFTIQAIASELRTTPDYAKQQLEELANLGLVRRCTAPECYLYESTPDLNETLESISTNYSRHRMAIINLLYSQPLDKIRGFSDAFKIKKD
jgi:DNA-binding MarR family transcriptional regulator